MTLIRALFDSTCILCSGKITAGDTIEYNGKPQHVNCPKPKQRTKSGSSFDPYYEPKRSSKFVHIPLPTADDEPPF